jgi:hypothetical protein
MSAIRVYFDCCCAFLYVLFRSIFIFFFFFFFQVTNIKTKTNSQVDAVVSKGKLKQREKKKQQCNAKCEQGGETRDKAHKLAPFFFFTALPLRPPLPLRAAPAIFARAR